MRLVQILHATNLAISGVGLRKGRAAVLALIRDETSKQSVLLYPANDGGRQGTECVGRLVLRQPPDIRR